MKRYRIRGGDSLESIAGSLGMTVFDLKNFHNNHCDLSELIGNKIPSNLKEILYRPREDSAKENISILKEKNSFNLTLNPDYKKSVYSVLVSFTEDKKEDTLQYTMEITWMQRNKVRLYRKNLFINKEEPGLMADELADKTASVLYPMELLVNAAGEIIALDNYKEILRRWEDSLPGLQKMYTGEVFDKYIQVNEQVIRDSDRLFHQLKKDWFLQSFFNGLYRSYSFSNPNPGTRYFPVISSVAPVEYLVESRIELREEEGQSLVKIDLQGKVSDLRSRFDFENGASVPLEVPDSPPAARAKGEYSARYFMDTRSFCLTGLYLECSLNLETTRKVYVTASRVKEPDLLVKEEGIIEIGKPKGKEPPKRNSFLLD